MGTGIQQITIAVINAVASTVDASFMPESNTGISLYDQEPDAFFSRFHHDNSRSFRSKQRSRLRQSQRMLKCESRMVN